MPYLYGKCICGLDSKVLYLTVPLITREAVKTGKTRFVIIGNLNTKRNLLLVEGRDANPQVCVTTITGMRSRAVEVLYNFPSSY